MEVGFSLLSLWLVVAEEAGFTVASVVARSIGRAISIPFGERATHQHARARRQRSVQAVSREGGRAKRNLGLARALRLLKPALFVTASEFHGVPFGPAPAGLFRQSLRLVMVWFFCFCERPNGMEVGFSLLSLWWVVAEKSGFTVASVVAGSVGRATTIPFGGLERW